MSIRGRDLAYYKRLYDTVEIVGVRLDQVRRECARIMTGHAKYKIVEARTHVPWIFPACIHELEADCNFKLQILNGQPYDRRTTIVPKGEGPWNSWEDAAIYALQNRRKTDPTWTPLDAIGDWTVQECLRQWERWNGGGYMNRGKHSPYLWAGCQHGIGTGYYTTDHGYDPNAQSRQIGAGVLLWYLKNGYFAQKEKTGAAAPSRQ